MTHCKLLALSLFIATVTLLLILRHSAVAESADPPVYLRQSTWHETLRVSREALLKQEKATGQGLPLPEFGTSDYTFMAWIRTTAPTGALFSKSSPDGPWACNGKVFFVSNGRLCYDVGCISVVGADTPINDGKWHHVALTCSDGERVVEFFVDGRVDGRVSQKGNPDLPTDILRLGSIAPNFHAQPSGFNGDMDEAQIFCRRLSADEIAGHYRQPQAPLDPSCVGFWSFEQEAVDVSGNNNLGRLEGTMAVEGRFGSGLRFDGKSSVLVPNAKADARVARERLWDLLERDFPDTTSRRQRLDERQDHLWDADWEAGNFQSLARRYAAASNRVPFLRQQAETLAASVKQTEDLQAVQQLYHRSRKIDEAVSAVRSLNLQALRLAIDDLTRTFGNKYPKGQAYLARLDALEKVVPEILEKAPNGDSEALKQAEELAALSREALLSNPLLDFDRLLIVKRSENLLGLPQNWESNSTLPHSGYDNEIAVLSDYRHEPKLTTLFRPESGRFVGDVDVHFDADRMLFSMPGDNARWQIFELHADGTGLRQMPLIQQPDVDNYDACYLPNGNILFTSTAPFVGVPCVTGASHVSNIYVLDTLGKIRRLTFEQDHDWCPTVLNNGRVLYLRWEYADIPHYVSRILFHMNPDGTEQSEYYGSNSYWPNAMFYARPVPNHPTKFVAIIGGHHDVPRMGELVLFDNAKARHEASGVVQRIPGRGKKVEPIILDGLVGASWPKFLHPYPLSDKYFIVSMKPSPAASWGIYLVDVFDNMLLLYEEPGYAMLEPTPFRKTVTPPVIPDKVRPDHKDASVYIADLYAGPGLKGVPRGTVKGLRLFTYQFAYHGMGGQVNRVGLDGPWDIKRVMGTVPVEHDGSAYFKVPANTPISIQPLDAEGKALQLMRSWMTAMPGETVSCVGCHDKQNSAPVTRHTLAAKRPASTITPWYGPTRGFSFKREVQPVLDSYCVTCHDGKPKGGQPLPDFRPLPEVHPQAGDAGYNNGTMFTPSYLALRSYVRTPTIESDIHLLEPCEYHADTTRLVRLLKQGHHGVKLDAESWDRLITWIDLHAPAHGTWREIVGDSRALQQCKRRQEMNRLYANLEEDSEEISPVSGAEVSGVRHQNSMHVKSKSRNSTLAVYTPVPSRTTRRAGVRPIAIRKSKIANLVDLGEGVVLELVRIPSGEFSMGDSEGNADERPVMRMKGDHDFLMGKFEVTNEQFARFDPTHDSRIETGDFLQFSVQERGYPVNGPKQPVCRVSWYEAMQYCKWLSEKTGLRFTLPTEAEWEFACRAGTTTPLWYGEVIADFAKSANLADYSLRFVDTFGWGLPSGAVPPWRPAIESVNDKVRVSAPVGSFNPNPWGLHDMHGNVAEWTRTTFRAYPYRGDLDRNESTMAGDKVIRGGSWWDRPQDARSAYRWHYPAWRKVYDVGFRVVCEPSTST